MCYSSFYETTLLYLPHDDVYDDHHLYCLSFDADRPR